MVLITAILALFTTVSIFLTCLLIALLSAERRRQAEVARLEAQVRELKERAITPAERTARARRRREAAARHRRTAGA